MVLCVLVGSFCLWQRRLARTSSIGAGGVLSEQLKTNSLQPTSSPELKGSSSSAVTAVAQRSTGLLMMLRIVYQPARIIVGYVQVVTQIGPVLDLQLPEGILHVVRMLNFIDLQQIFELDCLSNNAFDFYMKWLVWVFLVPASLLAVVCLLYTSPSPRDA